jgi:hypothetical protein
MFQNIRVIKMNVIEKLTVNRIKKLAEKEDEGTLGKWIWKVRMEQSGGLIAKILQIASPSGIVYFFTEW